LPISLLRNNPRGGILARNLISEVEIRFPVADLGPPGPKKESQTRSMRLRMIGGGYRESLPRFKGERDEIPVCSTIAVPGNLGPRRSRS
jgi:hypothetical protein